jgi:hypothetical protein
MADHVRNKIRDEAVTALTGLTTTGARVYANRVHPMGDANLPGHRIYTNDEDVQIASIGSSRLLERELELVVEACAKENDTFDDTLDDMIKEAEVALAPGLPSAKYVSLKRIEIEASGGGDKQVGVARMTFVVIYITAHNAPDVAT